jgi:UrcA family protein
MRLAGVRPVTSLCKADRHLSVVRAFRTLVRRRETMHRMIAPCAALIGALAATAAKAETFEVSRGALGYRAGVETTLKRIDQFTDQICVTNGRAGLYARRAEQQCKDELTAEVISDIGDRRLNAVAADLSLAARR